MNRDRVWIQQLHAKTLELRDRSRREIERAKRARDMAERLTRVLSADHRRERPQEDEQDR
jgi:hypothetical protein